MVGNVDLDHSYPVDTENKEKSDTMRIINVVARVGVQMTSPHVLHIFQVLLAVCREEVKSADDVIFNGCLSSIDLLLVSKNRYFGTFLPALKILQLLGDIQSYCRKSLYYLFKGSAATPKQRTVARQRLARLKAVSLRVFHYVALLAFKNEAGDDVHIALTEYYKSIFCDRGWEMKRLLAGIKKDLYYYRQGFAWVMLPAAFSKFHDVAGLDSRLRFRVFEGCCVFLEGMLPRLSGLPVSLKVSCRKAICDFVHGISVKEVYDIKHTLPFTYLHAMKHIVLYNKRVELDPEWIASDIIDACVDDDSLQLSSASIRLLSDMEKLLGRVPKARETKVPTPVKVLHSQFNEKTDQRSKKRSRAASKSRSKVLKSLLAYRNDDATDEERAKKRRRREELKVEDRLQRQTIREHNKTVLSKEEREEKRKKILMAKQQRIAKNKERKRRVFHMRQKSFEEWRESKLASSDKVVPRPIKTQKEKR
ncbi:hypothetical protein ADEAN_000582300 [Angomonas deanei]|uniref:Uncharacterized protein n=1 Tax=Angomonas deanei TaxID=59799 RepID=A0A7G2CG44_9TRYP|nr:hypothetical protein ADEAN_000582300 [Angomonas deanei]